MADDALALKIKTDALRLLSFRPRSVEELRRRLGLKKYPADAVSNVIALLTKQGVLNDELFAKVFSHSKVYSRPVGKRQLEIELKKKGVPAPLIQKTLGELGDYDEKKIAKDLVRGRFLKMAGIAEEKKKMRLFGFLKRRGFSNDAIFSVINDLFKETEGFGE